MKESADSFTPRGWILYDGRCGMCSVGVRRLQPLFHRLGFATLPLQTPWVVAKLGRDTALAPREMGLLTQDGNLIEGVDVYLYVARFSGWSRPLAVVGKWRWIHFVLTRVYRWIAAHREQISGVCRLQPELRN